MPKEFSWFNVSGVKHPAVNQGRCGSCWAFAGVSALEMQSILEGNPFLNISKQQSIDWFVLLFPLSFLLTVVVIFVCMN